MATITRRNLEQALAATGSPSRGMVDQSIRLKDANLFKRLQTFMQPTWYDRSNELSPPLWALHGWAHAGAKDAVKCEICGATIALDFRGHSNREEKETQIKRYVDKLVSGHDSACPWAVHQLDESDYRFPVGSPSTAYNAFKNRLKVLSSHENILPHCVGMEEGITSKVAALIQSDMSDACSASSLALALFGWELVTSTPQTEYLQCYLCARKPALWNFGRTAASQATANDSEDTQDGAGSKGKLRPFHVVNEHK
ncbi:C3HC zinc finger-like-domain-containing protein [Phlyctochytrium arcticum]|nr:C3HC zinc finger-like-domain-containing protein [Phlyctochytrium arcticum]